MQASRIPFFDAHCDTVLAAIDDGLDFIGGGTSNVDLPRLQAAGGRVQIFAIFTAAGYYPDEGDATELAERALKTIHDWVQASGGRLRLARTAEDVRAAFANVSGPVYGLIALEGADPLAGQAANLASYADAGVRHVIPAWEDNAFAGGATGSQGPLTSEGLKLVEQCEALGVMVDVSHLSDAGFWQLCQVARRPFVASHSDCRAICPSPRNLTDEMIRALAERGGVMGINLAPYFLDPTYMPAWDAIYEPYMPILRALTDRAERRQLKAERDAKGALLARPGLEWAARHARHAIEVGGEDCVGLGGDLDGITFLPAGMTGVESYPALFEALQAGGLTPRQVEKVCWQNMARVYEEVLPAS